MNIDFSFLLWQLGICFFKEKRHYCEAKEKCAETDLRERKTRHVWFLNIFQKESFKTTRILIQYSSAARRSTLQEAHIEKVQAIRISAVSGSSNISH